MKKGILFIVVLTLIVLGCSQKDKDISSTELTSMGRADLMRVITNTNNKSNRRRAAGKILFRLQQKTRKGKLTIEDFNLLITQVQPLLSHKNPRVRDVGIGILYLSASEYYKFKSVGLRKQFGPKMCQIRLLILQSKNDPDANVRYQVVTGLSLFPQDAKRTYADVKDLGQDPDPSVRDVVARIKRSAKSTRPIDQIKYPLVCK